MNDQSHYSYQTPRIGAIDHSTQIKKNSSPFHERTTMKILLSDRTALDYLIEHHLCDSTSKDSAQFELKPAKNFNLLLSLPNGRKLLVKQERHNAEGKTAGEFLKEWQLQGLLQKFPELNSLTTSLPEVLHFDAENSIIILNYLTDYRDVFEFYIKEKDYPTEVATAIGSAIATIHRATFNQQNYFEFFSQRQDSSDVAPLNRTSQKLHRVTPEVFGSMPADGLKFIALYQRYDSLGKAIVELGESAQPSCLTHNDLKLNNLLLHDDWKNQANSVRLIDWERCSWGDPALDLGMLVASYLQLWLSSLVVSQSIALEEALRLAMIPLDHLQPSIAAIAQAYLETFPEILQHRPDFLQRVIQFAGLALIQQIQGTIQYQKTFDNTGICMLQVAKSLLCRPAQSFSTVFGTVEPVLTPAAV